MLQKRIKMKLRIMRPPKSLMQIFLRFKFWLFWHILIWILKYLLNWCACFFSSQIPMQILHRLWNIQLKYHTLRLVGEPILYLAFLSTSPFMLFVFCFISMYIKCVKYEKIWYNTGHEIVERRKYYCFLLSN